jgi:hypothetical protein
MSDEQFLDELRSELMAAAERKATADAAADSSVRRTRPKRPWFYAAAAAVVAFVVVGGVFVLQPAPASAGVDIIYDENGITILLRDLDTRAEEVIEAVTEAGLNITVEEVPVGPSKVGRFTGATGEGIPAEQMIIGGDTESGFSGVRLPLDFSGELHLSIGRPPQDGEAWAIPSDATAPGELLACEPLIGQPLDKVLDRVDDLEVEDLRVTLVDDNTELDPDELGEAAATTVISIISPREGELWIDSTRDPDFYRPAEPNEDC